METGGARKWIWDRRCSLSGSWTKSLSQLPRSAVKQLGQAYELSKQLMSCLPLLRPAIVVRCNSLIWYLKVWALQPTPVHDVDGKPDWDDDRVDRPRPGQTPWRPEHHRPAAPQGGLWHKTPPGEARAPAGQRWKQDPPTPQTGDNK